MTNAGIYARVSLEKQRERVSLESQINKLREYCKNNTWVVIDEYIDAKSGGNTDRPELQRLLENCRYGKIDVLLVYKLDRLSRSLKDLILTVEFLKECSVDFVSVTEQLDTTTATGKLTLHIFGAFAEFEREIINERSMTSMNYNAEHGQFQSKPPYGYRIENKKLVVLEDEAQCVRKIFKLYLDQIGGVKKLAQKLELPQSHIYRILTNKTYLGKVKWGDEMYTGIHEAIIDEPTFNRVSELLCKRNKKK